MKVETAKQWFHYVKKIARFKAEVGDAKLILHQI